MTEVAHWQVMTGIAFAIGNIEHVLHEWTIRRLFGLINRILTELEALDDAQEDAHQAGLEAVRRALSAETA